MSLLITQRPITSCVRMHPIHSIFSIYYYYHHYYYYLTYLYRSHYIQHYYTNRLKYSASTYSNFYISQIIQPWNLLRTYFHCLYYISIYTWLYMHAVLLSRKFTTRPLFIIIIIIILPQDDRVLFCSRIDNLLDTLLKKKEQLPTVKQKKKKWTKPLKRMQPWTKYHANCKKVNVTERKCSRVVANTMRQLTCKHDRETDAGDIWVRCVHAMPRALFRL